MTDTWITITQDDVLASVNNSELTAAIATLIASGQASPLTILIPSVSERVRSYCRRRNTVGPAGTIPLELKDAAIDIIIYRCACRVNCAVVQKKPPYDESIKMLKDVASGEMGISAPLTATTDVTSAPSPRIQEKHHNFGQRKERGI